MAHRPAHNHLAASGPVPGRVEAFNRLVGQHQAAAYTLAYRVLGDPDLAADVTQSAFSTLYHQPRPISPSSFRASLLQQVAAACSRRLRAQPPMPAEPRPGAAVDQGRDREVQAGILALPPEERIVLVLADVCSLGYRDIASITGLPVRAVGARLGRARLALAAYLRG
jgi:RNA polymerase sigma-70 factor (ECF subfamily)